MITTNFVELIDEVTDLEDQLRTQREIKIDLEDQLNLKDAEISELNQEIGRLQGKMGILKIMFDHQEEAQKIKEWDREHNRINWFLGVAIAFAIGIGLGIIL